MSTVYYCIPCLKHFKCKKNVSEKEKQEREEEYTRTGEVPMCNKCQKQHWRCKLESCTECCKLNACNDIICDACKKDNIECKRVLPKTQQEFDLLKEKGLTFSSGQFEATENGKFHEQAYFQFEKRQTMTSVKDLFGHRAMNFPKYLNGDSDQNRDYSQKMWNRCKNPKHKKKCRCDFQDKEKICDVCNKDCIEKRTLAKWKATELTSEENGFFAFGNYRYLATANELKGSDEINEKRLEDIKRIDNIIENNLTVEDILKNKKELLPRSWLRSLKDLEYLLKKEKEIRESVLKRFWRPCVIYIFGPGGSGKSGLVQKLFREELYSKTKKQQNGSNWYYIYY